MLIPTIQEYNEIMDDLVSRYASADNPEDCAIVKKEYVKMLKMRETIEFNDMLDQIIVL